MNPGVFLLLIALLLALAVLVLQLLVNRPAEGWFAWTRDAFLHREDVDLDAEPTDLRLSDLLDGAETESDATLLDELVRR